MWSESGADTLEQALSTFYISNSEKGTQKQVTWLGTLSKTKRSTEQSAAAL